MEPASPVKPRSKTKPTPYSPTAGERLELFPGKPFLTTGKPSRSQSCTCDRHFHFVFLQIRLRSKGGAISPAPFGCLPTLEGPSLMSVLLEADICGYLPSRVLHWPHQIVSFFVSLPRCTYALTVFIYF